MKNFVVLLCLIYFAKGAFGDDDKCADNAGVANFHLNKILGYWYIHKFHESEPSIKERCAHLNITSSEAGKLNIHYSSISIEDNKHIETDFSNVPLDASGTSHYDMKGNEVIAKFLDTDYDNYFIRYVCYQKTPRVNSIVLVATRSHTYSPEIANKVTKYFNEHNFGSLTLHNVDHTTCGHTDHTSHPGHGGHTGHTGH